MRSLFLALIAAILGAALFHAYYLGLPAGKRCGWDHPIDHDAAAACRGASDTAGAAAYTKRARDDLDRLVDDVAGGKGKR